MVVKPLIEATVGHLYRGAGATEELLLATRSGTLWTEALAGPGGKFERGENAVQCLKREVWEEARVVVRETAMVKFATVDYFFPATGSDKWCHEWRVHYFNIREWTGEPEPHDGLSKVEWFPTSALPYEQMYSDMVFWFPAVRRHTKGEKFDIRVYRTSMNAREQFNVDRVLIDKKK